MNEPADKPEVDLAAAWGKAPVSMFFATVAGVGHLPGGPGTYAAALSVPALVYMSAWPLGWRLLALLVVGVLSVYWSHHGGAALREHDSQTIVIDEVVGMWVTLVWFGHLGWAAALVGFVAFRVFDILKPYPASWADRELHSGLGVVLDDVFAGLWATPVVWLVVLLW